MKTFCRILSCLLIALTLLSIVACGGGDKTEAPKPSTDNSGSTGANTAPVIGEKFDGEVIKFFINGGEEGTSLNNRSIVVSEDDDPTYEVNVMVTERNTIVESELGVKIELAGKCNMQEANQVLTPILTSHVYTYDIIGLYQYYDLGLALGDTVGSFYNYCNMPEGVTNYLNLEADYWSQSLFDTLSLNDTGFYLTGDLNQTYTGSMFVSFVNSRMWEEYKDSIKSLKNNPEGYTSIYDIVKNGYWTLDLWMELAQMAYVDTNNNDQIDWEDQCGFMTYNRQLNNIMTDMLAAGSNVHYSTYGEDGRPIITFNSSENIAFANKLYDLLCESSTATIPWLSGEGEDAESTYIMDVFAMGNVLLNVNTIHSAEEYLADMTDDFYVMPLPMFSHDQFDADSASLGYTTQLGDSVNQYAICKDIGDERIPVVTATMELLGYYSKKLVTPAYYDTALKDRYTRNPEDAEMIDLTKAGIYTDFATAWGNNLGGTTHYFREKYDSQNIADGMKTKNGALRTKMKALQTQLEEAFWVD